MKRGLIFFEKKFITKKVGIIGSGFSGLAASIELARNGIPSTVFEKENLVGGTTKMAVAGINAIGTRFQHEDDSFELFKEDILTGGKGCCDEELVDVMLENSASGIDFLENVCGIDLIPYPNLGGHTYSRAHGIDPTKTSRLFGAESVYKMKETADTFPELIEFKVKTEVIDIQTKNDECLIRVLEDGNEVEYIFTDILVSSGGYSANEDLISKNFRKIIDVELERPECFPTTNGRGANSKVLNICEDSLNAKLVDLGEIQVHPTAIIHPTKNPNAKFVQLASDGLRGCGGILVNQKGERFIDEVSTRDEISKAIQVNCDEFFPECPRKIAFLVFDKNVAEEFGEDLLKAHRHHKEILQFKNSEEFCQEMNVPLDTFLKHSPYPKENELNLMFVTPALHYTMGGVKIDRNAHMLDQNNNWIEHVYAAGECCGGIHGKNRLGGNALMDCIVFALIAARDIIEY